ncbi:hypothetical protein AB0C13_37700, partial [Streptomyces sp. NPDC049099]|uniref:telomere-protecting terminal protein Tpg n=1 Tax=Streptomyces sp. NPDC049099 TaxID=3155768 RepID=UPI00343A9702
GDSLDRALEQAFTRPAPKSAQAQMKYLVKQLKTTKAVAQLLGVSQRTVERYVAGTLKRPHQKLRERIDREVKKRWQPQVRARAKKKAATTDGLVVSTRARFGFTAAPGTTDDARIRDGWWPGRSGRSRSARGAGSGEQASWWTYSLSPPGKAVLSRGVADVVDEPGVWKVRTGQRNRL